MPPTDAVRPGPSLRIDELAITNFRTFRERTVIAFLAARGEPDAVVVFHGDNGSGKSNAMAALDLFFRAAGFALERGGDEGAIASWDAVQTFSNGTRSVVFAYQDRPHASEGPMEIEVSFADARLGRLRLVCTPSGDRVRAQLERATQMPSESKGEEGLLFAPVAKDERDQLTTWLLTPRGPGSRPLTILDARRRAQWGLGQGSRSLLPPEFSEMLLTLRTSRRPDHRGLWREFVELLHRFEALRGKEVSIERPTTKGDYVSSSAPPPELVVEERGRTVLGLDELSSGEQQVIVLAAASLLAGSGILAIQEPELSLDVKNQRLFDAILREIAARGSVDQVILESHVATFDGAEVIRFARRPDGTSEVSRGPAIDEQRREIARKAKEQGAEQRWITRDGYTQIPEGMQRDLRLADGGHVWFVKGAQRWEAWPEAELDELFGADGESERDG